MLDYAYIWDETDQCFVPQIDTGVFKGVRVDHLPVTSSLADAEEILNILPFVTMSIRRPDKLYFNLEYSDAVGTGTVHQQRQNVVFILAAVRPGTYRF